MTSHQLFWLLLAVLTGAVAALALQRQFRRWRMRRRFARGRVGEHEAVRLLERDGYRVLEEQISRETGFWIDADWQPVTIRADFLVEQRGKVFVAEVKTGRSAPNPASTATRRQLLEYHCVYDADGLLLVDMESRRLHCIRFDPRKQPAAQSPMPPWWIFVSLGAGGGLVLGLLFAGGLPRG